MSPRGSGAGEQVEGRQAVRELLAAGRRRVRRVMIGADGLDEIADLARAAGAAVRFVERDELRAAAVTDAPQGVVAFAEPIPDADLSDLANPPGGGKALIVVLDGVTDPQNLGAVMRSALCAGATGLVVARHRAAGLTPAAVKAAAGAAEHLPVATVAGIPAALAQLSEAGVWTVALDAGARQSLWDLEIATEPVALVLGAEGGGLSRLSLKRCELAVQIPLSGPLASLNVAAAATLACFEVARRRTTRIN